jgi:hypothetical protein
VPGLGACSGLVVTTLIEIGDGFSDKDGKSGKSGDRHPFIGIGISLPRVKEQACIPGPGRFLEYYQVPYTAYPFPP